jgi:hypothetical protein
VQGVISGSGLGDVATQPSGSGEEVGSHARPAPHSSSVVQGVISGSGLGVGSSSPQANSAGDVVSASRSRRVAALEVIDECIEHRRQMVTVG